MSAKWMRILGIGALLLNVVMLVYFFHIKNSFLMDEIFSYGHANSTQGAFAVPQVDSHWNMLDFGRGLMNQRLPGSFFHHYITVQPAEAFRYEHIWENLAEGVHPPLFYVLLHTVCSFTPNVFSKWQGAILNIPVWLILLWMLFKLAKSVLKDEYLSWMVVAFYAFSQAGLDTAIYIRGYLLQTLWAVCLIYQVIRLLQTCQDSWIRWLKIGLFSLAGMLTQYNSIVFSAIVTVLAMIVLAYQKEWKLLGKLAGVMLLSVYVFLLIFPQAISVLAHSERGDQVRGFIMQSLPSSWAACWQFISRALYPESYLTKLWSGSTSYWIIWYFGLLTIVLVKYQRHFKSYWIEWIGIVVLLMTAFVNLYMPPMKTYSIRYVMLLMPLATLVTISYIHEGVSYVFSHREQLGKWLMLGLVVLNSVSVRFQSNSPYMLYTKGENPFKDKHVLVVTMVPTKIYEMFDWFQTASTVEIWQDLGENIVLPKKLIQTNDYIVHMNIDAEFLAYVGDSDANTPFKVGIIENSALVAPLPVEEEYQNKIKFKNIVKKGQRFYDIFQISLENNV